MCAQLLECIRIGPSLTLPKIKINNKKRVVPGWNTHARPLQQTAAFWHKVWCDCGHPTSWSFLVIKCVVTVVIQLLGSYFKSRYILRNDINMKFAALGDKEFIKRERLDTALSCDPNKDIWK